MSFSRRAFTFFVVLILQTVILQGQHFPQRINYLRFVENKGQWNDNIRFKSEVPSGELIIQDGFLGYIFWNEDQYAQALEHNHDHSGHDEGLEAIKISTHAFKVNFLNRWQINKEAKFSGKRTDGVSRNYLKGNTKSTNVKAFGEIKYHEIYEGIDLRLYENDGALKYEYIVSPKSDPAPIQLEYEGVDDISITQNGELLIKTSVIDLKEAAPYAYQDIKGKRLEVECSFHLEGNILSYSLGKYNKRYPLVIDPQLIFSTYSGSTADNWGNTACLDKEGNLYTGGTVFSTTGGSNPSDNLNGFPATIGAFQRRFQGGDTDIGILKFDSSGTFLRYATYIGGNDSEIPTSTITNDKGELYILGITGSTNFPGAVNTFSGGFSVIPVGGYTFDNGTDVIVIHLSADGSSVINARYIGGSNNDGLLSNDMALRNNYGDQLRGDINIDEQGNVYVVSTTKSTDLPVVNAEQPIYGGGLADAFYFKLIPDLSSFEFLSYYGGNNEDAGFAVVRDTLNNVIIGGGSISTNLLVTDTLAGYDQLGGADAFVAKVEASGASILNAVKLGTPEFDQVYFIQTDFEQNLYVLGQTSGEYPVTSGAYNNPRKGIFIHKFGANFDTTFFSTTIGDTRVYDDIIPNISPTAFLVNECQNIFIAGWGGRTNYLSQIVAVGEGNGNLGIEVYRGYRDFFTDFTLNSSVPRFTPGTGYYNLNTFTNSYEPANQGNYTIDFDISYTPRTGNFTPTTFNYVRELNGPFDYSTGSTFDMPITFNAYQRETDGSDFYMMVLKKDADSLLYATYFGGLTSAEHVDGGTSRFDDQGIVYQSVCAGCGGNNDFPKFPEPDNNPVTYPKNNGSRNCNNGVFKFDLASLKAAFLPRQVCDSLVVNFVNLTLGGVDFNWDFGDGTELNTLDRENVSHRYAKAGTYRVRLEATDLTTCKGKDSAVFILNVREEFLAEAYGDTICQGDSIQLDVNASGTGYTYEWYPVDDWFGSSEKSPTVSPDTNTVYRVKITDDRGCEKVDTFRVRTLQVLDSISAFAIGSCKALPVVRFQSSYDYEEDSKYLWEFSDGFSTTEPNFDHQFKGAGTYKIRKRVAIGSCRFEDNASITVEGVVIPNVFTPNDDGHNETFEITGIANTGDWTLVVYNRWGKEVYLDESYDNSWSAIDISDGTYYYLVTAPDGTQCKGWVQITR